MRKVIPGQLYSSFEAG